MGSIKAKVSSGRGRHPTVVDLLNGRDTEFVKLLDDYIEVSLALQLSETHVVPLGAPRELELRCKRSVLRSDLSYFLTGMSKACV
ncbi:MAG: hypothetical protein ACI9IV_002104 [Paracoccaceae bacterium]|jgi:hypothetical protein|tara:strand:+ start:803 stop:1057 length:255 start_codon:yes stop_codon:yes gene_type:complete